MPIAVARPTSSGRRHYQTLRTKFTNRRPKKSLVAKTIKKHSGRNSSGKITVRHHGGAQKRKLRIIDWKRNKFDIPAKVTSIEYDPNRSSSIALVTYADGEQRYILSPVGLKVGTTVISSAQADIQTGNTLPLEHIPVGTPIHNIELKPGHGAQMVRSAGSAGLIQSKEGGFAAIQMPSKEIRLVKLACLATIGQVSNPEHQNVHIGKAGRKRHMGWRPTVRGTAQHPGSHPHGGGEGRSGVGMKYPKSPWGKHALGKKTRKKKKFSDRFIIRDRRQKS